MTKTARKYLGGSGNSLTFWIAFAASNVIAFYGYDQGVFGNIIISENFLNTFGNPSANLQGTMTSIYNVGCFFGAMFTVFVGDLLGRPKTVLTGTTVIVIGAILQMSAFSIAQLMVGRIIAGFGTGMNTSTAGTWQAETSKFTSRGKLIVCQMAYGTFGFSLSNWITYGFSFLPSTTSLGWRFPLAFQLVFAIVVYSTCPFLPESPRLLARKCRHDEACEVLAALAGDGTKPEDVSIRDQYEIIRYAVDLERASSVTYWDIFCGRGPNGSLRRFILGAGMQAMNELSGINVTSYYFAYVLINAVGVSTEMARILACTSSVVYDFFVWMGYFTIDRFGRRKMMMWSAGVSSLCFLIISICLGMTEKGYGNSYQLGIVIVTCFFVYQPAFGMGVLPIPWLYPTEINTLELRTKGAAMAMATNWIVNYMSVQITPIGIANIGYKFWILWAVFNASFVPITYFFYPETMNRTLEDIDRLFETHPGTFIHKNKLVTQTSRPKQFIEADTAVFEASAKRRAVGIPGPYDEDLEMKPGATELVEVENATI